MKKIGKVALFGMITAMVVSFVRADEGCAAGSPGAAHPGRVLVLPCVTDEGGNIVIDNIGNFLSSFDVDSDGLLSAEEQKALFALVGDRSCAPCPPKPKAAPPRGGRQRVHACGACGCDPCRCAACDHKGPKGPRSKMKGCPCGPKCDCPQCDCDKGPRHKGPGPGFHKGAKGPRPKMKGCPCGPKCDCPRCDCGKGSQHKGPGPGFHKGAKGPRPGMKGRQRGPKCDCPQCDCGKGPRPGMKGCPWVKKHDHFPCPQGPPAC
ncbi:MAG: hypothetical protein IJH68_06805, partial [Thermoguttaceae bacterium]|nr:hypothetical protein [Thermoguttaceae bacterium]